MGTPACRPLFPDNEGITLAMWRIRWSSSTICWPLARIPLLDPCTVVGQGRARIAFPELIDADYRVRHEAGRAFLRPARRSRWTRGRSALLFGCHRSF